MNESTDNSWSVDVDKAALLQWMSDNSLGNGTVDSSDLLCGGTQNILQRFTSGGDTFVLRRPPKVLRKESNKAMMREARVLTAIAGSDVPHPKLIASCEDESIIGATFYLMKSVDGFNAVESIPDAVKSDPVKANKMGLSAIDAILALGALDYKAVGLEGFGKPDGYHERQVKRWMSQLEAYHDLDGWPGYDELPEIENISRWLESNIPEHYIPGIIHGDCHFGNMLFDNESGQLKALVDWELSTIGDPLLDLGWLLVTTPKKESKSATPEGFPTADELIKYYDEKSHRDCSAINWYAVLACFKLAIILEGTFARSCAGKAPKKTGDYLHQKTIELLKHAQQWM